jgi:beta-RFAP synthase
MTRLRLQTPSRLHFGLLSWGPDAPRQFGGVGLTIDAPGLELTAEPASDWRAEGPLARRVLQVAERVEERLAGAGTVVTPAYFRVLRAPAEHVGLGVGTQLSLAVGRLIVRSEGLPDPSPEQLAELTGRGQRSGIGLHGFFHGGLIVDGGRRSPEGIPPLLCRLAFPREWSVLVLIPKPHRGLHGAVEARAFAELPAISDSVTDRLCRLVLIGLLPAVLERNLSDFGAALTELQQHVGRCFASAQGGIFAHPELERIAAELRSQGFQGVGQSSWGPTLYGFLQVDAAEREAILQRLRDRFGLDRDSLFWTKANGAGSVW